MQLQPKPRKLQLYDEIKVIAAHSPTLTRTHVHCECHLNNIQTDPNTLCEPLCMGWLERGSGGPGQLHSPMSTGEDSLAKSIIFGTIKDVAVAPTTREYSGQRTL